MALDLRAFGLQGGGGGGGMSMPGIPGMPSLTLAPGGGGPSTASAPSWSSSGMDSSGWAINFSGEQAATSTPTSVKSGFDSQNGLPVRYAQPMPNVQTMRAGPTSTQTGGIVLTPTLLVGVALVAAVLLKRGR